MRRSQLERSATTRELLITAALDEIYEAGLARLATARIASRAGVSRGALTHHYPAKEELIAAAFRRLLGEATLSIHRAAQRVQVGELDLNSFIDELWSLFSGRFQMISQEIVVECRHNTKLKYTIMPNVMEFHQSLDVTWGEFFRGTDMSSVEVGDILNMTACIMRGMGLQSVLREDSAYFARLIASWKQYLSGVVDSAPESRST